MIIWIDMDMKFYHKIFKNMEIVAQLVRASDCGEAPETASEAEVMSGVHIYDLDSEWFNSLSSDDLTDFFEFVELNTTEIIEGPYSVWKTKLWGEWEEVNNCYMNLEVA